jgi:hypothetical protein
MDVVFEVSGRTHTVPERQAVILAENLRLLARSEPGEVQLHEQLETDDDWRGAVSALADSIEQALVARVSKPLQLEGGAAEATHSVLRLMVGMDTPIPPSEAAGLRDALGTPVSVSTPAAPAAANDATDEPQRFLTAPELTELLVVLFALAVLTVIVTAQGIVSWYVLGPVIAALLGVRVATTRVKGKLAWSLASVVWWAIFLIPAMLLVLVVSLLIVVVLG